MVQKDISQKTLYILKIVGFTVMYSIVKDFLILLNDESWIQNWSVGLIGMIIFSAFYIIDNIDLIIFRIDRFNEFMILFFLSWLLADLDDFLIMILTILS
jgi:hypothetical protein